MNNPCPERLLWRHLKYILKHREKMVDAKSAQRLMVFDKKSRIRRLPEKNSGGYREGTQRPLEEMRTMRQCYPRKGGRWVPRGWVLRSRVLRSRVLRVSIVGDIS
jgi:hypothetical protein